MKTDTGTARLLKSSALPRILVHAETKGRPCVMLTSSQGLWLQQQVTSHTATAGSVSIVSEALIPAWTACFKSSALCPPTPWQHQVIKWTGIPIPISAAFGSDFLH